MLSDFDTSLIKVAFPLSNIADVVSHPDHTCMKSNFFFFFDWDSLHARLDSHYEAWSCKKKKHKKIKAYMKSV